MPHKPVSIKSAPMMCANKSTEACNTAIESAVEADDWDEYLADGTNYHVYIWGWIMLKAIEKLIKVNIYTRFIFHQNLQRLQCQKIKLSSVRCLFQNLYNSRSTHSLSPRSPRRKLRCSGCRLNSGGRICNRHHGYVPC